MSIERNRVPQESLDQEPEPSPETKRSLDKLRGSFARALILGGVMAAMEACGGFREEEIQELPKVSVQELASAPEKFVDTPMLRTEAYPIYDRVVRKPRTKVTMEKRKSDDLKGLLESIKTETVYDTFDFYKLQANPGPETAQQAIAAYINRGEQNELASRVGKLGLDNYGNLPAHRTRVVGKMQRISDGSFAIEIAQTLDLDQPVERPEKK